jgi:hypothetical protein
LWKGQGRILPVFNESGYQIALNNAAADTRVHESHWDSNPFRKRRETIAGEILFFNISLDTGLSPFGWRRYEQAVDDLL